MFDVAVVFPLTGRSSGSVMKTTERYKINKYRQRCVDKGIGFEPLIFESFGKMHCRVINLVGVSCFHSASKIGGDRLTVSSLAAVLSRYWLSVISFALQRSISTSILSRLRILTSSRLGFDYSVCDSFVLTTFGNSSIHFSDHDARQSLISTAANISHAISTTSPAISFGNFMESQI